MPMRFESLITIEEKTMTKKEFAPVTPGEMLKEEFLAEYGLSQNQLAKAIGISPNRITEIVNNRRRITADTALRLSFYFGNSPEFWMNLQSHLPPQVASNRRPSARSAGSASAVWTCLDTAPAGMIAAEKSAVHRQNCFIDLSTATDRWT